MNEQRGMERPSRFWTSPFMAALVGGVAAAAITLLVSAGLGAGRGGVTEYARFRVSCRLSQGNVVTENALSFAGQSLTGDDEIKKFLDIKDDRLYTGVLNGMAGKGWTLVTHSLSSYPDIIVGGNQQATIEEYVFSR